MKSVKDAAAASRTAKSQAMGCGVPGRKTGGRVGCDTSPLSTAGASAGGRKAK